MSIVLIEDTRQQKGKHDHKRAWWNRNDTVLLRSKLPFGDYAAPPARAVDTKQSISELAKNVCGNKQEHARFRRECVAARDAGCKLTILVENLDGVTNLTSLIHWENPRLRFDETAVDGFRLAKACATMTQKYDVQFKFCRPDEAAQKVLEILELS